MRDGTGTQNKARANAVNNESLGENERGRR